MEKNTCKLCFRNFANGRALGGHMRSHVAATTKAAATAAEEAQFCLSSLRWASSDEYDEDEEEGYGLRENPKKSVRLLYPEFSSAVVQDRDSEAESSRATATHRLRSKRPRPPAYAATPEPEPVSSVSDPTAEEDVAISLMLLSRDTWKNDDDEEEEEVEEEEEEEEEVGLKKKQQVAMKGRCKYQCVTCKKVFRSYQALGGHRASHKKFKSCVPPPPSQNARSGVQIHEAAVAEKVVHECPVCLRVFASGQALGGHKRSHLTPSTTTTSSSTIVPPRPLPPPPPPAAAAQNVLIDLNLPAPMEEDADQLSAVSDELNWGVGTKRGN